MAKIAFPQIGFCGILYCFLWSAQKARVWLWVEVYTFYGVSSASGKRLDITHGCILPVARQMNPGFCYRQTGHTNMKQAGDVSGRRCLEDLCFGCHILICIRKFDQSNNKAISFQWISTYQVPGSVLVMKSHWSGNKQLMSHLPRPL